MNVELGILHISVFIHLFIYLIIYILIYVFTYLLFYFPHYIFLWSTEGSINSSLRLLLKLADLESFLVNLELTQGWRSWREGDLRKEGRSITVFGKERKGKVQCYNAKWWVNSYHVFYQARVTVILYKSMYH